MSKRFLDLKEIVFLPPQDVGAADGAEGPEEDSGSRSNKELERTRQEHLMSTWTKLPEICHHFNQDSCCRWQRCNDSSSELLYNHGNGSTLLEIRADSRLEGKVASENNVWKEHHAAVLRSRTLQPAQKPPRRRRRPQQHQQREEAAGWERRLQIWLGWKLERRCLWGSPGRKSKQKHCFTFDKSIKMEICVSMSASPLLETWNSQWAGRIVSTTEKEVCWTQICNTDMWWYEKFISKLRKINDESNWSNSKSSVWFSYDLNLEHKLIILILHGIMHTRWAAAGQIHVSLTFHRCHHTTFPHVNVSLFTWRLPTSCNSCEYCVSLPDRWVNLHGFLRSY